MRTIVFLIISAALFEGILCGPTKKPKAGKNAINMEQIYEANVPEDLSQMSMNNFMNLVGAYQVRLINSVGQMQKTKSLPKSRSKIDINEADMFDAKVMSKTTNPAPQEKSNKSYDYEVENDGIYLNNKLVVKTTPEADIAIAGSKIFLNNEEVFDAEVTAAITPSPQKETTIDEIKTQEDKAPTPKPKALPKGKATKKKPAAKKGSQS